MKMSYAQNIVFDLYGGDLEVTLFSVEIESRIYDR